MRHRAFWWRATNKSLCTQTRVVKDDPNYVHAVILSVVWGFPDDFGVEVGPVAKQSCATCACRTRDLTPMRSQLMCNSSMTQLFIQSEQRSPWLCLAALSCVHGTHVRCGCTVGTTDGGVNEGHVTKFLGWFQSHTMPAGICTTP